MISKSNINLSDAITVPNTRLRTFDFLRGLAITCVIIVHASQTFPAHISVVDAASGLGRFGVQLFYFISALTMCYMWMRREGESYPILKFYIRRFFRIAPLFWLAIPIYLITNGVGESYWAPEGIGTRQVLLTATFLHGFWPDSINSVVPGGWSIAVEMTFYALFPFLIIKIKGNKKIYLYSAFAIWALNIFIFRDVVANFLSANYITSSTTIVKDYLYLNFLNQAPIFLLGCYLYFTLTSIPKTTEISFLTAWLLLAAVLKFIYKMEGIDFLGVYMMLGIVVFLCIKLDIKFKLFEFLGRNSYAIYLTHFFVLHHLQQIMPLKNGLIALLLGIMLTTALSYVLSRITYVVIEKNVQHFVDLITLSKPVRPKPTFPPI